MRTSTTDRYPLEIQSDFDAWAEGFRAQARCDRGRRLTAALDITVDEDHFDVAPNVAESIIDAVELVLFVSRIDGRSAREQRQFLAKQVYDSEASSARYLVWMPDPEWPRVLVDDLREVSLVEPLWRFEAENELDLYVARASGTKLTRDEQTALARDIVRDLRHDANDAYLSVGIKKTAKAVCATVRWLQSEMPPLLAMRMASAAERFAAEAPAAEVATKRRRAPARRRQ